MILVVGATGYIGRYFCVEMIKRGVEVLALGRSRKVQHFFENNNVPFQYFDLNNRECFDNLPVNDIEAIVDLSACLAELETPIDQFFQINTVGVAKVLEYARINKIKKVVVCSSHKVYNDVNKEILSESDSISFTGPHSPYIISKIAAENFVSYYNKDFGMNAIALRLTGVHGYGEILGHLNSDGTYKKLTFEIFFEKALEGEDIEVWGNQNIKRDHIYIKDVVDALYAAVISKNAKGIFNIASGVGFSQYDEAVALANVFNPEYKKSTIVCRPELAGLSRGYIYDISKAKRELNWCPQFISLIDMLSDYRKEWISKKYHNYHYIKEEDRPASL